MRKYDMLKKQRQEEYNLNQETENSDLEVVKKYKENLEKDWNEILEAAGEIDCPLCCLSLPARDVVDESKWNGSRAGHVAEHLLLLALKSLPNYEEHIEEQKEVEYLQSHLPTSKTRGNSVIRQDLRNNSNPIVRAAGTQSSSVLRKGETAIHPPVRTSLRQPQRRRNEAIAQELQRWREGFSGQQVSFRTSNNGQQAATIFPIQEGLLKQQPVFETALPTSSGKKSSEEMGKVSRLKQWMTPREPEIVDDGALLLEYPGAETPARLAHFSPFSPTPRNFNGFMDQHESKGEEKEGEEDDSIDGDEFELPSLAKHAIQSHLEPMDIEEEEKEEEEKEGGEEEEEEEEDTWEPFFFGLDTHRQQDSVCTFVDVSKFPLIFLDDIPFPSSYFVILCFMIDRFY
ncbi:uncharacterized protein Triagg1_9480 [Trichoderma aggressivum f. europaeum]|uniref:Uncharacterized protein n=1 Tax=Trichoderma aggressivum f. europaeum TaxID=173218 RepID=A0AAE1I6F1_9HYPO|nr:hypothetical protein Triagg1_9480 [Trichoderma aggressivum f. europaeum]